MMDCYSIILLCFILLCALTNFLEKGKRRSKHVDSAKKDDVTGSEVISLMGLLLKHSLCAVKPVYSRCLRGKL